MTGPEFRAALTRLGLRLTGPNGFGQAVARIGGEHVPDRTVQGYAADVTIPATVPALLMLMERAPDTWRQG